jgi:TorA maturation chaperone TorD
VYDAAVCSQPLSYSDGPYFPVSIPGQVFHKEPSMELLTRIRKGTGDRSFPFSRESERVITGAELMAADLAGNDLPTVCDKLKQDYTRLFIGPGELPAPPWESACLHNERLLF